MLALSQALRREAIAYKTEKEAQSFCRTVWNVAGLDRFFGTMVEVLGMGGDARMVRRVVVPINAAALRTLFPVKGILRGCRIQPDINKRTVANQQPQLECHASSAPEVPNTGNNIPKFGARKLFEGGIHAHPANTSGASWSSR
jgi:hypothetical protein